LNRVVFLGAAASLALVGYILEMVRRRKMREEYSILWLSGGIVMLVLVLRRDWLESASAAVGIFYPPSFLFLVAILFILLILIHFSITVSRLYQMNKKMAQELALLRREAQAAKEETERG
jgi:hypothetical protein